MRTRHTREEMKSLLEQRIAEKLTMNALSGRSGISVSTLNYWSTKLRRERANPPRLVPIELVSEAQTESMTIEVGQRTRVHVGPGFDEELLSRVIRILAAQC